MYDIIGDIHGHADALVMLLKKLGYQHNGKYYQHAKRQVIFVGDFIDRGPKIKETLQIVRAMVDNGSAKAVMGNHEYNAIAFHTKGKDGKPLRAHSVKNIHQHKVTMQAFAQHPEALQNYIAWFKNLPLFLELDGLRVIHASWIPEHIDYVKKQLPQNKLTADFLAQSALPHTTEFNIIDDLLKGKEMVLPEGFSFKDKDGHERKKMRVKWWLSPKDHTFKSYAFTKYAMPNIAIPTKVIANNYQPYPKNEPPVVFGHYWLVGQPILQSHNICCTDYSIAKGGNLVAYRWDGEQQLSNEKWVVISEKSQ